MARLSTTTSRSSGACLKLEAQRVSGRRRDMSVLAITVCVLAACPTAKKVTDQNETKPVPESASAALPQRLAPLTQTSGTVPHVQINVQAVPEVDAALFRRVFSLPDVENRPTIVSLPGARGIWIDEKVPLSHAEAIASGREFAHIHPDGSLHAPLPYGRALEAVAAGWAERHPWADQQAGWEGLVMLFTPQSMEELDVTFQLIVESYNHVTGRGVQASDFQ